MKVVQDLIELDQGWQYSVLPWRLHRIWLSLTRQSVFTMTSRAGFELDLATQGLQCTVLYHEGSAGFEFWPGKRRPAILCSTMKVMMQDLTFDLANLFYQWRQCRIWLSFTWQCKACNVVFYHGSKDAGFWAWPGKVRLAIIVCSTMEEMTWKSVVRVWAWPGNLFSP
jgi:hypothetical protein